MELKKDSGGWHLDKTFNIGYLISTLAIAGSVFVWAMRMDTRVTVLESEQAHVRQDNDKTQRDFKDAMTDVKSALVRIEYKLDTKQDKR